MSHPNRKRIAIVISLFIAFVSVLFIAREIILQSASDAAADRKPTGGKSSAHITKHHGRTLDEQSPAHSVRVDSKEIWDFDISENKSSIFLALDEAALRDADGKETIVKLTPPATLETLPARLAELSAPMGVLPVAYLSGEKRSISSRRFVTPDLRVKLDAAAAKMVADENDLVIKERPTYAPDWVIMTAATPLAALDAMNRLRTVSKVASADVLLAAQQSLRSVPPPNDPLFFHQWHLLPTPASVPRRRDVNILTAWNYPSLTGNRGAGVRIGVVDDGLQAAHPDLAPNVNTSLGYDWNGRDSDPNPSARDWHGTSCAGNAAAKGNNGLGVSGTAPDATLVGMRLVGGASTDEMKADAMFYQNQLIHVKTNSWGPRDDGKTIEGPLPLTGLALQYAATNGRGGKGTIFLWAAGNGKEFGDNSNYDGFANSIYTIPIGATRSDDVSTSYSEPGANIVVCAPSGDGSIGITTTDVTGALGYNNGSSINNLADLNYTNNFTGTSSSTPTAAGIVALMLSANPQLGWRDVKEILIRTAHRPTALGDQWATNGAGILFNHNVGAGLIDAAAAVNLAKTWSNLPEQTSHTSTHGNPSNHIPDSNSNGVTLSFNLVATNIRVEHVTLKLNVSHSGRGDLKITLTSPSGMVSELSNFHNDPNDNYNWTFSSVRHWGENSKGTWKLNISDCNGSVNGNSTGGMLNDAQLQVYGSKAEPDTFLFWRHDNGQVAHWILKNGLLHSSANVYSSPIGWDWKIVDVEDLNGDGYEDIIWRHDNGLVAHWILKNGIFHSSANVYSSPVGWEWKIVDVEDLNGDGHADMIWRHDNGQVAHWILKNGILQTSANVYSSPVGWEWKIVDVQDLDGDAHADMIWRHDNGQVAHWILKNGILQSSANVYSSPIGWEWKIVDVQDLNGDGHDDMIWRHDNGQVVHWILKNGLYQTGANVYSSPIGWEWKIVDVKDLNGDAHADMIWRHVNGQVAHWILKNGILQSSANVYSSPIGWEWKIVDVK